MRLPRNNALDSLRLVCKHRQSSYTVTRPSTSFGTLGETEETSSTHTENLWLGPNVRPRQRQSSGEHTDGDLDGYALHGADIQMGDRVTYNGVEYEVSTEPTELPSTDEPTILELDLEEYA